MKNPREIASVVRTQTFYAEAYLNEIEKEEDGYPLTFYGPFSRFSLCVINQDKKAAAANMRIQEMNELIRRSKEMYSHEFGQRFAEKDELSDPAYTVTFKAGKLKGMSPAAVITKHGEEGIDMLRANYKWLKDNLAKFPANQELMDAIMNAVTLHKDGGLKEAKGVEAVVLYESGLRPLVRKARGDGMSPVHEMKITWTPGASNPVNINVTNYFAPVIKLEDGRLNVKRSAMDKNSLVDNTMALSVQEWMEVMHSAERSMKLFEILSARKMFDLARKYEEEFRGTRP